MSDNDIEEVNRHHFKRMDAEDYVGTLVKLEGSVDDGEASAWMTTMAWCDAYQQRESVDGAITDGDRRILEQF
eukprot:CAMPEP_0201905986 /NCGR_PEP_ID=MMETSP0902-20130614/56790_1 /ASSEMBLY_ACC=CAM_ASM_000551 /TAXON_ID=420261 /ORGANISM="Thalassiosira antarctica, Strain CCMP982" /LENGTH=72 /DNA_ID=CAMNT_0048440111 /DNA_START=1301 /DNA_END=1519 /DNA_ORIENTATION=-